MIEFQNVTFTYHSTERESGVYNLNLTIPDGQVVLFCGGSGCGKTPLRLIKWADAGILCRKPEWRSSCKRKGYGKDPIV